MRYGLAILMAVAMGWGSWVVVHAVFLPVQWSSDSKPVVFVVRRGESLSQVLGKLENKKLVRSRWGVRFVALFFRQPVKVGEYALNAGLSPLQVLQVLSSGKSIQQKLRLPEGLNMYQIADRVAARGIDTRENFLRLCRDQNLIEALLSYSVPSLEGYLFPETYMFTSYTRGLDLIQNMLKNFHKAWAKVSPLVLQDVPHRYAPVAQDPHKVVILASMVEKETGQAAERPVIASVFHNRLRRKMRLESDPTIIYGVLDLTGKMLKNIRKKHILEKTRYNTYRMIDLPHGPIANPGLAALRAVLQPKKTKFLYFVSKNNGQHKFSTNYADHKQAVWKYQILPHR